MTVPANVVAGTPIQSAHQNQLLEALRAEYLRARAPAWADLSTLITGATPLVYNNAEADSTRRGILDVTWQIRFKAAQGTHFDAGAVIGMDARGLRLRVSSSKPGPALLGWEAAAAATVLIWQTPTPSPSSVQVLKSDGSWVTAIPMTNLEWRPILVYAAPEA